MGVRQLDWGQGNGGSESASHAFAWYRDRARRAGRGPAQAAESELSAAQRLQDRREVAAGTRAQVLGFEDGRFYANGWHTTGEMGGIFTPPLKLVDSLYLGVNKQWVGQAARFTSGWGYTRYALPPIDGIGLERTDVAPTAVAVP